MKQQKYIFAILLSFVLFSCEKEELAIDNGEFPEDNEYFINPEDTAGIIVPKGYSLVMFPGSQLMTRATINDHRITHLQYIIYQKDDAGNYIQFEPNKTVQGDLTSWPLKVIARVLPEEKDYKVVFLGNVNKTTLNTTSEVLTGTGKGSNYNDARILLPRVEFTATNMYYMASSEFTTDMTKYVPITLKRIVSRNDITKEGLSGKYAEGVTSESGYKSAYWKQLVETKLKECIFTGEKSAFKYQLAEALKKNMIYPLIYIGLNSPEDATSLEQYYSVVKQYNSEWDSYKPADLYLKTLLELRLSYPDLIKEDYPNNFCIQYAQYLYDTFIEEESKDPQAVTKALEAIFTDNIDYVVNHVATACIDAAVDKTITALTAAYTTSGVVLPWRFMHDNFYSVVDINSQLPSAVDFNLNPTAHESIGEKFYRFNAAQDYVSDKYISIITLGEPNANENKLEISKLYTTSENKTSIDDIPVTKKELVSAGFSAGNFHRNIRSVTTQVINGANLINPQLLLSDEKYKQKIEVNYYHVFQAMNPVENANSITLGNDAKSQFTIQNIQNATPKIGIMQSYILNTLNYKYILQQMQGNEYLNHSFPFVTFTCPDLSSTNLNVTTEWTTRQEQ